MMPPPSLKWRRFLSGLMITAFLFLLLTDSDRSVLFADAFIGGGGGSGGGSNHNDIHNDIIRGAFLKVQADFEALTQRATARHIVVPSEDVAVALKRKIRSQCLERESFVVDVFEKAAEKYSNDAITNSRGGLLGELAPLGHSRRVSRELDRLRFSVPLGQVVGPLKTDIGYHLLLVSERTNCPKLDGSKTTLMQTRGDDVFGTLLEGEQVGRVSLPTMLVDQLYFWLFLLVAGGVFAELSERVATIALASL